MTRKFSVVTPGTPEELDFAEAWAAIGRRIVAAKSQTAFAAWEEDGVTMAASLPESANLIVGYVKHLHRDQVAALDLDD